MHTDMRSLPFLHLFISLFCSQCSGKRINHIYILAYTYDHIHIWVYIHMGIKACFVQGMHASSLLLEALLLVGMATQTGHK